MRESGLRPSRNVRRCWSATTLSDALADALADVAQSLRGRVVFVAGEAGAGKTALLRAFCDAAPRETDVHWATCDALATPRPLGPLLDLADVLGGELRRQVAAGAPPHDVADVAPAPLPRGASRRSSSSRTSTGPTRRRWTCCGWSPDA